MTALQAWSAGEQAALSQELATTLARAASPSKSPSPSPPLTAECPSDSQATGLDALDALPAVPRLESVRPLNRAAPARLAASLKSHQGSFPALPVPPAIDTDGIELRYISDSSSDDHEA